MSGGDGSVEAGVYCPNCAEGESANKLPPKRTQVIECVECARPWNIPTEQWRVYLTDDDPPKPVAYSRLFGTRVD
jgi:hypothetical protein